MNAGQDISFFKTAEELKKEEKPVSAPAPKEVPETKTDATQTVKTESDGKEAKKDGTEVEKTDATEKEAQAKEKLNTLVAKLKANPKLRDLVQKIKANGTVRKTVDLAKNPSATGVVGGIGLGTLLAALVASRQENDPRKKRSVMSYVNPLLAGGAGAAAGYLGGNFLEKIKPTDPEKQMPQGWARTSVEIAKDSPKVIKPGIMLGGFSAGGFTLKDITNQGRMEEYAKLTKDLQGADTRVSSLIADLKEGAKAMGMKPGQYAEYAAKHEPDLFEKLRLAENEKKILGEALTKTKLSPKDALTAIEHYGKGKPQSGALRNALGLGKGEIGALKRGRRFGRLGFLLTALGLGTKSFVESWNENTPENQISGTRVARKLLELYSKGKPNPTSGGLR